MLQIATAADKAIAEAEMPIEARWSARTLYGQLAETADRFGRRPAISFQLKSGPKDRAITLDWAALRTEVTRAANLLRRVGIGPGDVVAYVLPNCLEAAVVLLAGATAGVVSPVNPLLTPEHMAGILRDTRAKVVVTLAPFPKADLSQKVAEAVAMAPDVETVLEVDLKRYLSPPLSWIVPAIRPKRARGRVSALDLAEAMAGARGDALDFVEADPERFCAFFHTGGTTGLPKVARHRAKGMLYNGWCGKAYMFNEEHVLICPLPMFHVFAAYPVFMSCLMTGAHMVMVTPQGYRGEGVFDNFWKLVERWKVTFLITVPTAAAALMQRKTDADVSTLRYAVSGSAAMPVELFRKFEAATGVSVLEGYGLTEATCLVAINPPSGERKIGSVGLPFPYTEVKILHCGPDGGVIRACATDEVGEICVRNPGTSPGETYSEPAMNQGLYAGEFLRTGDLGRLDADGYLWITGRAKDLIIRGGHNIDPGQIEDAMMRHPDVAFVGAIGQPDAHSGEVPAVYVELVAGGTADADVLMAHAQAAIGERAAMPKHLEVLEELPKTAVGKVFKPDLRKRAIKRVYGAALIAAGSKARVVEVVEDRHRGLVALIAAGPDGPDDEAIRDTLGDFLVGWRWLDESAVDSQHRD